MFLTFDSLLNNYIHISNTRKLHKKTYKLYTVINNCNIINLVFIISDLYKLYKILFLLSKQNSYITVINTIKLTNNKFIYYLTKFTISNCLNTKWIKGFITNTTIIPNITVVNLFINKLYKTDSSYINSARIKYLKKKYNFVKYLKSLNISEFIFFLTLDNNTAALNECLMKNKFIMGVCDLNFNTNLTDLSICGNNLNHKSLNFFLKFITIPAIKGSIKYK
ncbi:ribosomal protein S2 (apicoplast) [Babesia ovis]|uniref:Ribosomal protein S2 n=1 Tax=Babesia ovis TaxID=5869 RepID=A0A9W5WWB3_BABOV|nr:ribosomal protein S2 [Babesia ovis]